MHATDGKTEKISASLAEKCQFALCRCRNAHDNKDQEGEFDMKKILSRLHHCIAAEKIDVIAKILTASHTPVEGHHA